MDHIYWAYMSQLQKPERSSTGGRLFTKQTSTMLVHPAYYNWIITLLQPFSNWFSTFYFIDKILHFFCLISFKKLRSQFCFSKRLLWCWSVFPPSKLAYWVSLTDTFTNWSWRNFLWWNISWYCFISTIHMHLRWLNRKFAERFWKTFHPHFLIEV